MRKILCFCDRLGHSSTLNRRKFERIGELSALFEAIFVDVKATSRSGRKLSYCSVNVGLHQCFDTAKQRFFQRFYKRQLIDCPDSKFPRINKSFEKFETLTLVKLTHIV